MSRRFSGQHDVMALPCSQCLYSENRIVSKKRAMELIMTVRMRDRDFLCHKGTISGREIVCRGSYDCNPGQLTRIAGRLGMIRFIDSETLDPVEKENT